VTVATAFAISAGFATAAPASAHCPGTYEPAHKYAGATRTFADPELPVDGVKAQISYANPTVCSITGYDPFSLEGISTCNTVQCSGWVQTGWVKHRSYTEPKAYCEFKPVGGSRSVYYYEISNSYHTYQASRVGTTGTTWQCYLDGVAKAAYIVGFALSEYITVQGETDSTHSTIGLNAPSKLNFTTMRYRRTTWQVLNIVLRTPDAPYGNAEPSGGSFQNWTNAH
jgi:hypothetical protein